MRVLLLHLDGRLPNLALARLAAWHRQQGDHVTLRRADNPRLIGRRLDDPDYDRVYGSLIFERTRPNAELVQRQYPGARLGGTGWRVESSLADVGIAPDGPLDFTDYPTFPQSIGFTQRGCRLRCSFCVVPRKEGAVRETMRIADIFRGDPWPREVILLDNDFFGQPRWADRIRRNAGRVPGTGVGGWCCSICPPGPSRCGRAWGGTCFGSGLATSSRASGSRPTRLKRFSGSSGISRPKWNP